MAVGSLLEDETLKRTFLALCLVAAAAAVNAATLYNNTGDTGLFTSGLRPNWVVDDFDLDPTGANLPYQITHVELGISVNAATNLDMLVEFYQDINFAAGAADNVFPAGPVASYLVSFGALAAGTYTTGLMELPDGGFFMPSITDYASMNHAVSIKYLIGGTSNPNPTTTALFKGDVPPSVGGSEDVYWRDADANGTITGSDARFFGGAPAIANIYMRLDGHAPVPEPASMAVLGMGALALLRRRKK